jgi:ribonuclease Z
MGRLPLRAFCVLLILTSLAKSIAAQSGSSSATYRTRAVLLGTGNPNADPERWGPGVAIVVDGRSYLVDAGSGIVRQAARATRDWNIPALAPDSLSRVFLTHLHSDHTIGLPDLLLSPFVLDRPGPLEVYGPAGTQRMAAHIMEAWDQDVHMRLFGLEPRPNVDAWRANVHEISEGIIYEDDVMRVSAFWVPHGSWPYAYAYRFEGPDRVIVVSGDTGPAPDVFAEACNGCDVLIHEVYSTTAFAGRPAEWQRYHADNHTSTHELAQVALRARPRLLVLYHQLFWGVTEDDLIQEMRDAGYVGDVSSGKDIDIF